MGEISKTVFITGATGFIGSHLLRELLHELGPQSKVFVLSRKPIETKELSKPAETKDAPNSNADQPVQDSPRIINLLGNLEEIERFEPQLRESNYVFHLAADASFSSDIDYEAVNTTPTKKIVDLLKGSPTLQNLIFVSTIGALDRAKEDRCAEPLGPKSIASPTSSYGKSKLVAEEYIKQSGLPYTIVRPTWVYGRHMRAKSHISAFVSMVHGKSKIIHFNFPGQVSLIHVEDLAYALARIINNPSAMRKTYIAETESLSIGKIFSILYEHIKGEPPKQLPIPRVSLLGKIHHKIPLAISNLFIDYLCARDEDFKRDLLTSRTPLKFEDKAIDVIATHISVTGYWLITGANSGIGYELACRLHAGGKQLILVDKELTNLTGFGKQMILPVDLSDRAQVLELLKKIESYRMHVLINNAGVGYKGDYDCLNFEQVEKMTAVNVMAPLLLTKHLLPTICKNDGAIVNMASSAGYNPLPGMSVYAATKSFLLNWSLSLWYENRKKCLVVTCSPSGTNTNFQKNAGVKDTSKLLSPEYVARAVYDAIRKKKSFLFLGFKNKVFIYVSRMLPTRLNVVLWGELFKKLR